MCRLYVGVFPPAEADPQDQSRVPQGRHGEPIHPVPHITPGAAGRWGRAHSSAR